jgi:hypothetical protein
MGYTRAKAHSFRIGVSRGPEGPLPPTKVGGFHLMSYTWQACSPAQEAALEGLKRVVSTEEKKPQIPPLRSPDFLSRTVALIDCVRLSLRRAAYVVVAGLAK